jgi:hypothetical protein
MHNIVFAVKAEAQLVQIFDYIAALQLQLPPKSPLITPKPSCINANLFRHSRCAVRKETISDPGCVSSAFEDASQSLLKWVLSE